MAVAGPAESPAKCMVELEKGRKRRWMNEDIVRAPTRKNKMRRLFSILMVLLGDR